MTSGLYIKTIGCPVCDGEFQTCKVKTSALRITKRDEDMCPYYGRENPIFYQIIVCPKCGYANFESKYHDINSIQKDKLEGLKDIWKERDLGGERSIEQAIDTYKLAILCLNRMEYSSLDIGKACLRLAWLYRYKSQSADEIRFIDFTIENFKNAYTNEMMIADEEEIIVLFIIGELSRRRGQYREALLWFDKVLKHKDIKRKRHIEIRTREQWQACREEYKRLKIG